MYTVYFKICFVIALFLKEIVTDKCHTPEKQEGQCTPLYNCPKILKAFANPPIGSETYLRQYVCEGGKVLEVCCDNSTSITKFAEQHLILDSPQVRLEEILPECDEYEGDPYESVLPEILAKHPESGVEYVKCFGALINGRYVITAAECVAKNDKSQESAIVGVRFTSSQKSYFFAVEEEIPHPFYDSVTKINNLALLRLNGTVLEDGVRLYLCIETDNDVLEEQLAVQWRKQIFILSKSLSRALCTEMLENKNVDAIVTKYDICTEDFGNSTEITCNEYAGSPLIHNIDEDDNHDAVLLGIASSKIECADGLPNVYTNLIKYRLWLRDNMRPWWHENEQCRTPSGDAGQSLPIYYCPALIEMLSDVRNGTRAYLDKFINKQEDYGKSFLVCCPKLPNSSISENRNVLPNIDVPPQFLDERCGLHQRDDYFSSSTAIAIDEFPWIATIVKKDDFSTVKCGGVLINARYVLTTATCTLGTDGVYNISVRLGDLTNQNEQDCVKDVDIDGTNCTEYFGVEDIIMHPFFIWELDLNDVGLLRLNKTVQYTDFIRPICLPVQGTVIAKPGDTMYKSGWSFTEREGMKIKVLTTLLSYNECQRILRKYSEDYIHPGIMCTRDYKNTSSLTVYGAVMFSSNYQWHVEGVFSRNYVGSTKAPHQHTNVSKHVNWILENMRPWK